MASPAALWVTLYQTQYPDQYPGQVLFLVRALQPIAGIFTRGQLSVKLALACRLPALQGFRCDGVIKAVVIFITGIPL